MDLHSYPQAERGRFDKILNQFLLKSLHIILDSRVPANRPHSQSGELKKSDKWFNLVLGDRPTAMDSLSFWNRSLMEPMIIDIILVQKSTNSSSELILTETVVERWTVLYEYQKSMAPQIGDSHYKKTYKKSIILLRSVYSMLRLLPAYKAFRKLRSLNEDCDFDINYKICSFSSPFSRAEELSMKYSFVPVDAEQGHLSISVIYCDDLSPFNLDTSVSCTPAIISDYVGSPLTEPMREFPSTSFPIRGRRSSTLSPFQRPHSWTSGLHRDTSLQHNQLVGGFSPPLHRLPYEYSSSPTDMHIHRNRYKRSPAHHGTTSDELLSPAFSSSPSPSPPAYLLGGSPMQSRLCAETAPISIPHPIMGRSPRHLSPNLSESSRHSLPPLSPKCIKIRAGEVSSGSINVDQKVSRDAKEDSGRFSSLLSSSSSPRVGFSRSSSRLSFQDDFSDCDFSCPFIVDDDPPDTQASTYLDGRNSSEVLSRASSTSTKSQDAAVGALVQMLRTAPPLRQDSSYHTSQSSKVGLQGEEVGAVSDFFKPRKTSDALQELKVYKDMKDLLLSKSAAHILLPRHQMVGQGKS